jgi:hypothetical protein
MCLMQRIYLTKRLRVTQVSLRSRTLGRTHESIDNHTATRGVLALLRHPHPGPNSIDQGQNMLER